MSFSFNIPMDVRVYKKWVNPYITDGLVAMWDGIWNAGWGVHSAFPDKWVDLTGNGNDAYPSEDPLMFDDDSLVYTGRTDVCCWSVNTLSDAMKTLASRTGKFYTVQFRVDITSGSNNAEVCSMPGANGSVEAFSIRLASGSVYIIGGVYNQHSLSNYRSNSYSYSCADLTENGVKQFMWIGYRGEIASLKAPFEKFSNSGKVEQVSVSPKVFAEPLTFGYNGRTANKNPWTGKLHNIRFYDRELTDDEVKYNFDVDLERFGTV